MRNPTGPGTRERPPGGLRRALAAAPVALLALVLVGCAREQEAPPASPTPAPAAPAPTIPLPTATPFPLASPEQEPYRVLLPDGAPHTTANVRLSDVLGDGTPQLLVTEPLAGQVVWLRSLDDPVVLKDGLTQPVRAHAVDIDGDGDRDILVADIGVLLPTDDKVGRVVLLRNDGAFRFEPIVLLEGVGRVVCAEGADLDGDGDMDVAVCVFGHEDGKVLWLEQKEGFVFEEHVLDPRPGSIHAFPFDADADGDLDLAVALSQDSEEVILFRNDGTGTFEKEVVFAASDTYFGMSGIELADLDQDGDIDILLTNGDTLDLELPEGIDPNDYHGLSWLENDGLGQFTDHHDVVRHWGAYAVRAADIDGDSDLDLVLSGMQVVRYFPGSERQDMVWLENDGAQNFTRHPVDLDLPLLITIEVADLDGDGAPEVLTGTHNFTGGGGGHRLVMFNIDPSATGDDAP